jgi:hypothetical protein
MTDLSRAQFVARGLKGGVALVAGGAVLAAAAPALGGEDAEPGGPPEEDLAIVRLAASAELLAEAFYTRAIDRRKLVKERRSYLVAARRNEREHYTALAAVLGAASPLADDFQFAFAAGTFETVPATAKVGVTLETALVGAYVGAVAALQTADYRNLASQIAASEAMHLSVLSEIWNGAAIGPAFPAGLSVEQATDALAPFLGE